MSFLRTVWGMGMGMGIDLDVKEFKSNINQ